MPVTAGPGGVGPDLGAGKGTGLVGFVGDGTAADFFEAIGGGVGRRTPNDFFGGLDTPAETFGFAPSGRTGSKSFAVLATDKEAGPGLGSALARGIDSSAGAPHLSQNSLSGPSGSPQNRHSNDIGVAEVGGWVPADEEPADGALGSPVPALAGAWTWNLVWHLRQRSCKLSWPLNSFSSKLDPAEHCGHWILIIIELQSSRAIKLLYRRILFVALGKQIQGVSGSADSTETLTLASLMKLGEVEKPAQREGVSS